MSNECKHTLVSNCCKAPLVDETDICSKCKEELEIKNSKKELLNCIHNLMAVLDSPVGRLHNKGNFVDEARKIGKKILNDNNLKT